MSIRRRWRKHTMCTWCALCLRESLVSAYVASTSVQSRYVLHSRGLARKNHCENTVALWRTRSKAEPGRQVLKPTKKQRGWDRQRAASWPQGLAASILRRGTSALCVHGALEPTRKSHLLGVSQESPRRLSAVHKNRVSVSQCL